MMQSVDCFLFLSLPTRYICMFFCHLLIFSKSTFSENFIRNIIIRQSVKQAIHFVGPDLGPNCLQRLLADDTSRQRVIYTQKNN